ncbi:cytochrome P450 [Streptomyces sp. NPDC023998]|uniref:cytochrome P450 n=1 Tax=Streptomyces sp. NPDC023998 TaxID=3154597 RepID=UPI0033EB20EE
MTTEIPAFDADIVRQLLPIDPFDPAFQLDPYPVYRRIREESGQIFRMPAGTTIVLSHELSSAIFKSPHFGFGDGPMISDQFYPNPDGAPVRPLMFMDPPDHTRIRPLVNKAFTPRTVERLRGKAEQYVRELLVTTVEESTDGTVDLMNSVLRPLSGLVIGDLLDVPQRYHQDFFAFSKESGRGLDPAFTLTPEQRAARDAARGGFIAAGAEMVAERRIKPGDDLVSELVAVMAEGGERLTDLELSVTIMNLLAAGFSGIAALTGNCTIGLLREPGQLAWFRDNTDQAAPVVEELLRMDPPLQLLIRSALADTEVGGFTFAEGDHAVLLLGAANRDPEVYENPDTLDLTRPANRNLGFGHGIHFCVAAPIARMAAQVALVELVKHDLELVTEHPEHWPGMTLRTLGELPVRVRLAS